MVKVVASGAINFDISLLIDHFPLPGEEVVIKEMFAGVSIT